MPRAVERTENGEGTGSLSAECRAWARCLSADPSGDFLERHEDNNDTLAHIRLTTIRTRGDYRVDVEVVGRGTSRCQTQVPYPIPELP